MIWKNIYTILILLVIVSTANAEQLCLNSQNQNIPCTILTPSISCGTYYYEIYKNSTMLVNNTLTQYNQTVYELSFNQTNGDYLIRLCDGTT